MRAPICLAAVLLQEVACAGEGRVELGVRQQLGHRLGGAPREDRVAVGEEHQRRAVERPQPFADVEHRRRRRMVGAGRDELGELHDPGARLRHRERRVVRCDHLVGDRLHE